jgi:hypothetical protein
MLDAGMKTFATINVRKYDLRLNFDTSNLKALDAALAPAERADWVMVWRRPPPGAPGAATVAAAAGGLGEALAAGAGAGVGPRGSGSSSSLVDSVLSGASRPSSGSVDGAVQIDSGAGSPASCSTPRKGAAPAGAGAGEAGAAAAAAADAAAGECGAPPPSPESPDTAAVRDAAAKAAAALRAAGAKAADAAAGAPAAAGPRHMSWHEFQCNAMAFL